MSMMVTNWYCSSWLCFKRSSKFEKNHVIYVSTDPQRQQREEGRCIPLLTIACIVAIRPLGKQKDGPLAGPRGSI
ncbi:hypothetical protein HanHA89_Chr17g0722181 [Helianthus annuus]|nr:hypothetical protein HanHA89_Chr17g0722181 [Helianthus annuus]